jgi:hypothetical protein
MTNKIASRVTDRFLQANIKRVKTAGEVRFIKDRTNDKEEWAYGTVGPSRREINRDFVFKTAQMKPLAKCLRSVAAAQGHAMSAFNVFTKLKSAGVSPDGNLGGKGYIQQIKDMRRSFNNTIEALSSIADTLHDELNAPHWEGLDRERDDVKGQREVKEIVDDAEEIREDPEGWAEKDMEESFGEDEDEDEDEGG